MYYIINQTDEIIAADMNLLTRLDAKDVHDLYKKVALGEITFLSTSAEELVLQINEHKTMYQIERSKLSSILGELTIVRILKELFPEEKEKPPMIHSIQEKEPPAIPEEEEELLHLSEDQYLYEEDTLGLDIDKLLKEAEEESTSNKEALPSTDTASKEKDTQSKNEDELLDLLLPDQASETIKEISYVPPENTQPEPTEVRNPQAIEISEETQMEPEGNTPIFIDVLAISKQIGITPEDYNTFLNEYIDTAINLEKDLQSQNTEEQSLAIKTLSHLSDVLHLPKINEIMDAIESSEKNEQQKHIESLYTTLSRLTTHEDSISRSEESITQVDDTLIVQDTLFSDPSVSSKGFGTIDLSDVQPIHFDFRLEEAANDLSLPVELIEEFVNDFVKQAKEETPKILEAYERGELETIQRIGHLLKGAASNLRITPLAETLYDIQFCNDNSQLEPLIKNYWAHFLSFEKQMNTISK